MIANITPLIRLPSRTDVFDYFVPEDLRGAVVPGSLVKIPFRASKVAGVVLGLSAEQESKTYRTRPIDSVIEDEPVLTWSQIVLIQKFSAYYFVTPGSVARLIVPERPERFAKDGKRCQESFLAQKRLLTPFSISRTQLPALKEAAEHISSARFLTIQDVSSFVWLILHLIKYSEQSQILVLVPTIAMIEAIAGSVHKMCSGALAVLHSGLAKGAYWSEYQKIRNGAARIILSTRQGVFLPIQNRSHIIFFDSTSDDFKQYDQHPRYDARIVGSWLSEITKSKLLFAASSEVLAEQKTPPLPLPPGRRRSMSIALIDMKNEMQRKDFSVIAGQTLEAIRETLALNKKIVVIALREESERGVSVAKILGILTGELKNCKVMVSGDDFEVLVTTPGALEGLKLSSKKQTLGLLIFASIEPLLAIPDYRSRERSYYRLKHWRMLAQEAGFERIILQSYSPDSPAIRAFAYGEFEAFRNAELKNRKELNYPPFTKLVKLSQSRHAELDSASLREQILKQVQDDVQVIGPFTDARKRQSLLIKLSKNAELPNLSELGTEWIIDRDPENVL